MNSKQIAIQNLVERLNALGRHNHTVVFTNGCFDILHAGHIQYLTAARAAGDILVVGVNSDQSVKTIKGDKRPIIGQDQRVAVLSGLASVDYVVLFDEPDPGRLIVALQPDVLAKGTDWPKEKIVGAEAVEKSGGRILQIPFAFDISSSEIIQLILDRYGTGTVIKGKK